MIFNYDHLVYPTNSLPYTETSKAVQQLQVIKPDTKNFLPHIPSRYSVEFFMSLFSNESTMKSTTKDTLANRLFEAGKKANKAHSGFEAGLNLIYTLKNHFSIGIGAGYSKYTESYQFNFTDYYSELNVDTTQYYILFPFSPPVLVTEFDSTILTKSKVVPIDHDIIYESFTLTTNVRYTLPLGAFLIEPQLGINTTLITLTKGNSNFNKSYENVDGGNFYRDKTRFDLYGKVQLGYLVNEKINLFVLGGYQTGLTNVKTVNSFYEQKNNRLSFGCGLKYNLFKSQAAQFNLHGSDLVNN